MNWLAHLYLSEPTPAFRLGGILPDLVPASELVDMPPEIRLGIARHHKIDAFTDSHALFRQSVQRLHPPFRRFGGILIDVFYDHFLSTNWSTYSETLLRDFVMQFYDSFEDHRADIPLDAYLILQKMQEGNWLCSYGDIAGIEDVLRRIGARLRRPFDLSPSISFLERNYDSLNADFTAFFPKLMTHAFSKD